MIAAMPALMLGQACRVCGCTQDRACSHPTFGPCWWIAPDLCSHCGEPTIVLAEYHAVAAELGGITMQARPGWLDTWAKKATAALEHATRSDALEI